MLGKVKTSSELLFFSCDVLGVAVLAAAFLHLLGCRLQAKVALEIEPAMAMSGLSGPLAKDVMV